MARKVVERNIAYDDVKKVYYASFDYGTDSAGKRIKRLRPLKEEGCPHCIKEI